MRTFLKIENTRIGMRNFAGEERKYNPAGRRNFCVFIPEEDADRLKEDGWNIRSLAPRDPENDSPVYYLPVAVAFDYYPPEIWIVTKNSKTKLTELNIKILDWAEIKNVDITIRPYSWAQDGKSGIKAYVKSMYATIVEDELAEKYHDVPDSAMPPDSEEAF